MRFRFRKRLRILPGHLDPGHVIGCRPIAVPLLLLLGFLIFALATHMPTDKSEPAVPPASSKP